MGKAIHIHRFLVLGICILSATWTGCGSSGSSSLNLARSQAVVSLEVQASTVPGFGDADSISLRQRTENGELICEITATKAQELKGLFCELHFDPDRVTPIQAEPSGKLGSADETLSLAAVQPGRLLLAQARIRPMESAGFTGDGVLAQARFAWKKYDPRAAAGITCRAGVSSAPTSALSAAQAHWSGGDVVEDWLLNWDYANQGDYDQNSETGAPDLAPLASHFMESAVPDKFARPDIRSVIDGDNNGELASADLVPIAQNFGNTVEGYHVYASTNAADYPANADAASTLVPLDSVLKSEATGNPLAARLVFEYPVTDVVTGVSATKLWVRPYHGEHEGIASNLVDLADLGPVLALETEPADGSGTVVDPYIVDTATPYQFRLMDSVVGDVTATSDTEYFVSENTAGSVNFEGILDLADTFAGDFNVRAAYAGVPASPVLNFRVLGAGNPIMQLLNPPGSGNGIESDPFIVNDATVYQFSLMHLLDGYVSSSADTVWTVNDLAGSIVKGSPCTLDITDGYTGTFTVSATYKGAGSIPSAFYLRVPAAGSPLLSLAAPPLNGQGLEFDPYEMDNTVDYTLLLDVAGTDVGVDAATVWTLSDPAAGSVITTGAQAVLQIADSYAGVFTVGATYNGVASIPAAIWLDGTPAGLPDPPVADLQITPSTSTDDPWTEFTFNASGSTATVGGIDYYSWDYEGDGVWEVSETTTYTLTHTFGTTGSFNVTVRVTDDRGATDSASVEVTVTDNGNLYPTADLVAQSEPGGLWYEVLTAVVPVTINFDASYSTDPDGTIDHYTWDLDGDGVFSDLGAGAQQSYGYTADGVYYVGVKAYDDDGAVDTAFVELTLTQPGGNMTPQANLQADTNFGLPPLEVDFDASLSSDPNGDLLTYLWDWNNDGTFEESTNATPTASHTYSAEGNYIAVVKVSDDGGLFDTASVQITVDDGVGTWHFVDVAVPDGTSIDSCGQYCSLAVVDGLPAIVFSADIPTATDYNPQKLMYVRATDANGTAWNTPAIIHDSTDGWTEHGYAPEIKLVGGIPVVAYASMRWNGSAWYYTVYARTATDAQGSAWGNAVVLAGDGTTDASLHLDLAVVDGTAAVAYYFASNKTLQYRRAADATGATWNAAVTVDTFAFTGTPQTVDPSLAVVNGTPAVAYYYYLNDINTDELRYARASNATGSAWGTPLTLSSANGFGFYNKLVYSGGKPVLGTVDTGQDNTSVLDCLCGADANGASWGAPQVVHSISTGLFFPEITQADMAVVNGTPCMSYYVEDMLSSDLHFVRASAADGSSWQGNEKVLAGAGFIAYETSLAEVNGHPAIAYGGDVDASSNTLTGLKYSVYY